MKYFCLKNLSMVETTMHEIDNLPTLYEGKRTPDYVRSKEEMTEYSKLPTTEYCFYSTIEGINPSIRISKENPPHRMHGFTADYDAKIAVNNETIAELFRRGNPNCMPKWITQTPSGNARLIWVFEEPVRAFTNEFQEGWNRNFLKVAKVKQLLPGFDEVANRDQQYFALGTGWMNVSHQMVSKNLLWHWAGLISEKVKWNRGQNIPMENIRDEMEVRFPGRWKGGFEINARGRRFWDEAADNDTAAIVRESGMQCFTGTKDFVTWAEIFGRAFVEKYEADKIGEAISKLWFDGREYWRLSTENVWHSWNKEDTCNYLVGTFGLEGKKEKDEDLPEIKRAILAIHNVRLVDAAVPIAGQHSGICHFNGRTILNTGRIRPVSPLGSCSLEEAMAGCQFMIQLITELFGQEQMPSFLAWLKRFYLSFLEGKPLPGQAVFLAGAAGIGKTFIGSVLGRLVGGSADASEYMMGKTPFNAELMEYGLWTIDDSMTAADTRWHAVYSAMVKRMVANRTFMFNQKYKSTHNVPWMGRLLVTCNADPESLRVLPDTDITILDKVMIFKALESTTGFKIRGNADEVVRKELPYFARFMQLYVPEASVEGSERYGVKSYHHPELLSTARSSTQSTSFLELLEIFLKSYFGHNMKENEWRGSSTELLQQIFEIPSLDKIAHSYKAVAIGRALGQLMAQGKAVRQHKRTSKNDWVISRTLLDD